MGFINRKKWSGWLLLALVAPHTVTLAQTTDTPHQPPADLVDMSIEQLMQVKVQTVYGASKYEQKVTQAPSSVSIVTADEIKKFGYRSLPDLLRSIRGFYVSHDRNYGYVGSRGFLRPGDYNTRYLFLINGHRINDNIYDAGWVGTDGNPELDIVDRVEIIRGPSSSIYGSSAFFGVVNIVTKSGRQVDGVEVSTEAGSFDTYKGRFTFGKKFQNDIEWLLSGSYYSSEGQRRLYYPEFDQRISTDPRARNNGIARNSDEEEYYQAFSSLGYHDFTLTALYVSHTKEVPTASFGTLFGIDREQTIDERAFVELKYDHQFGENTEALGRISYDAYPYLGDYPYDAVGANNPADAVINKDVAFGDWITAELQLKQRFLDRHTLIFGAEYRENLHQHLANYDDTDPRVTYVEDRRRSRTFGVYAQAEAVLLTNLLLNAGIRYDYYYTFGDTLNPRVGLIYSPWEKTTFKLLYGQAFRAPNEYELYYGGPVQGANPNLEPETIRTYEAIYEQYLAANLRFSASAYYYRINGLISQTPDPITGSFSFANVNPVQAQGVEFELEGTYAWGLLARASYAFQRAEDVDTGDELSNSPRHLAKANLLVPLYQDKIFSGLELQYTSRVKTLAGNKADDFVVVNWTLFSQKLIKGLELSAGIYNLLDTKYGYPGAADHLQDVIQQDGRSLRVKLTYKF